VSALSRCIEVLRAPLAGRLLKLVVAGVVLASILAALRNNGEDLLGRLEHVSVARILVALGMCAVYRVVNAYGWVLVLRALGYRIRSWVGVRIWLVSESLRWLPGSVWGLVSRVSEAGAEGVPTLTASLSAPLELTLTIAAWSVVALVGFGASGTLGVLASRVPTLYIAGALLGGLATLGAALALAQWAPTGRFARKLHGLLASLHQLRRLPLHVGWLGATLAFYVALAFFNGVTFMVVLSASSDLHPGLLASSGINAAGWLLGFFAFFAPSGLGVREATTTALLAPLMPRDAAVVGALLWRVIQIVVELVCLAASYAPALLFSVRRSLGAPGRECEKGV
jgi:glycosyltransferase 2 family protein